MRFGAVATFAAAGLVAVTPAPGYAVSGCPTAPDKCFSTAASPSTIPQNTPTAFGLTIANESTTNGNGISVGSVNVTIPSGVAVSNVTVGGVPQTVAGNIIQLRNLGIAPGTSKVMSATVSAENATSACWATVAKQSNDFNGAGNSFVQNGGCAPSAFYSAKCQAVPQHDGCVETIWHTNRPFSITTSLLDSTGTTSLVTSTFSNAAIPGPDQKVPFVLYNKRGGTCLLGLECVMEVVSPHGQSGMAVGSDATLVTVCDGSVCPQSPVSYVLSITNENTGTVTPELACPLSLYPVTPTKVCGSSENFGSGVRIQTEHLSELDDWKAGGINVPIPGT
jgi:hypothetical protein